MKAREIRKPIAECIANAINNIIKSGVLGRQFVRSDFVRALKIVDAPYTDRVPTLLCRNENKIVKPVNGVIPIGKKVDSKQLYYFAVDSVTAEDISSIFEYRGQDMRFIKSDNIHNKVDLFDSNLPVYTVNYIVKVLNDIKNSGMLGEEFLMDELRVALQQRKSPYYNQIPAILRSVKNDIVMASGEKKGYKNRRLFMYAFKDNEVKQHMITSICEIVNGQLQLKKNHVIVGDKEIIMEDCIVDLSTVSDADLISELRRRGIEVKATKKVVTTETIEL